MTFNPRPSVRTWNQHQTLHGQAFDAASRHPGPAKGRAGDARSRELRRLGLRLVALLVAGAFGLLVIPWGIPAIVAHVLPPPHHSAQAP